MSKLWMGLAAAAAIVMSVPACAQGFAGVAAQGRVTTYSGAGGVFEPLNSGVSFTILPVLTAPGSLSIRFDNPDLAYLNAETRFARVVGVFTPNSLIVDVASLSYAGPGIDYFSATFVTDGPPAPTSELQLSNAYPSRFSFSVSGRSYFGLIDRATTAVPEAETWMMLLAGVGIVGASLRRRRAVSLASA